MSASIPNPTPDLGDEHDGRLKKPRQFPASPFARIVLAGFIGMILLFVLLTLLGL